MNKIILITICLSSVTLSQISADYQYSFIFSDEFNNSEELFLGKDPFGSDGIDTLFGEEYVPQVPAGEFGVRFQLAIDTSITTIKDIRFGCYCATGHEHLIDLSYATGSSSISAFWEWDSLLNFGLMDVMFLNPYNGQVLAFYSWFSDSSHFYIPQSLDKIKIMTTYNGTLSCPEFEVTSPNGGETLIGGEYYTITWWSNGIFPPARLEYTSDAGNTWVLISDSLWYAPNSYEWLVPYLTSNTCLVRIGDYPCAYDQSDSYFTIAYPVSTENETELPTEFSLEQNYPNPFNPITNIKYQIPEISFVTLKIYDVIGNQITTLVNEEKPAGFYNMEFDASILSSGVYFYSLQASNFVETKKMILIK